MLASQVNQSTNIEATAVTPTRTANILRLEFSGVQHEPVLLSPGKWSIGASTSNQIVLDNDGVALRQFLIIVTEHRSVIKDWSADGLWNGRPFESAVLGDGDKVEIAGVELSFRVAKSLDLISQLPYVADHESSELVKSDTESVVEVAEQIQQNTVYAIADGMLSFEDSADRLDELVNRIESSVTSDTLLHGNNDVSGCLPQVEMRASETQFVVDEVSTAATRSDDAAMELQATSVDADLRQLEELRAAVQQEREQLLEKRALLVQESLHVESQLNAVQDSHEALPGLERVVRCCDSVVDESASSDSHGNTKVSEDVDADAVSFNFDKSSLDSLTARHESVAAEREKLRHLLEEFDSVDEVNCDEAASGEVTVGVAQTNAEYSVMNASRLRDDAVKQLDELVLAATGGQEPQIPANRVSLSGRVLDVPPHETSRPSTTLPKGEYSSEPNDAADDHGHSALNDEPSPEYKPVLNVEASMTELGTLINKLDPAATQSVDSPVEFSSDEKTLGSEADEEAGEVALDGEALVERKIVENQFNDGATAWDLTALTRGVDASNAGPHGSTADDVPVRSVESETESIFPEINQQIVEVADADSRAFETDSAQQDSVEDSCTLESSDFCEIVEQRQAETVSTEIFSSPESMPDRLEGDASVVGVNSESVDLESNAEACETLEADESTQVDDEVPSWFDSKFMAEGDSVVENDPLAEKKNVELAAVEDGSSPDCGELAVDLRQKLAEMFDLPALSENTESSVPDESLKLQFQQFRDEPQSEIVTEAQAGNPSSALPNAESIDSGNTPAATLNFDPMSDSTTEDGAVFESETLDEFPATSYAEDVETDSQAVPDTTALFEPQETEEKDTSISAYMERLLARNRQIAGGGSVSDESTPTVSVTEPKPSSNALPTNTDHATEDSSAVAVEEQRENWLEGSPHHRQNRDQVRAELQVFRQIANQSARSAVATASRRDIRKQVIVKTIASVLALASGVSALLLDVSMAMEFGIVVMAIGLLFAGDLTLSIFRNWKYVRELKRAASALEGETSPENDGRSSDNVDSTTA